MLCYFIKFDFEKCKGETAENLAFAVLGTLLNNPTHYFLFKISNNPVSYSLIFNLITFLICLKLSPFLHVL